MQVELERLLLICERIIRHEKLKVAAKILQDAAHGKNYKSDQNTGARRLCDAIVLGGKR
ncbi:hypothetical protein Lser_V15G04533 [Lactuca serriola]